MPSQSLKKARDAAESPSLFPPKYDPRPYSERFWAAVAKGMPGRTAADCLDAYVELNRCPVARFSGSGTLPPDKAPRGNSLGGNSR